MIPINDPIALAEVEAAFAAYESALVSNDVSELKQFFWDSPDAVRFGANEQLYGHQAISRFREQRVVNFTKRDGLRRSITVFNAAFASVMYEYISDIGGGERQGRQSQTWVKFGQEWKIVSAHVSLADEEPQLRAFVRQALALHGLEPDPAWTSRIQSNFAVTAALAKPLMEFPLDTEIEPAPVFAP